VLNLVRKGLTLAEGTPDPVPADLEIATAAEPGIDPTPPTLVDHLAALGHQVEQATLLLACRSAWTVKDVSATTSSLNDSGGWPSKYEEVYLKEYAHPKAARGSLATYLDFYNHRPCHQALDHRTPADVYYTTLRRQSPQRPPRRRQRAHSCKPGLVGNWTTAAATTVAEQP
jgi:hypothetical protein